MSWEVFKLEDLCTMKSGGTPSRNNPKYYGGKIPWCKISDIEKAKGGTIFDTEEKITEDGLASINNRIFNKGTLLLAMYGSVGKVAFINDRMATNQAILGININDENKLNYKYLIFWFESIKKQLLNRAVGVALQNISLGIVKQLEIPLPPLAEQKAIAEKLDKADALRKKDQELLKYYDELAQSVFIDMFGDPVKNEKGWEVKALKDLVSKECQLTYGIVQPGDEFENGTICIRPVDLISKEISLEKLKRIDPAISKKFTRTILKGTEILVSVRGSIGAISVACESLNGANVTRGIVPIWFDDNLFNSNFFYSLFITKEFNRYVKSFGKGATLIQINLEDFRKLLVINPPLSLQQKFANIIENIEEQKKKVKL